MRSAGGHVVDRGLLSRYLGTLDMTFLVSFVCPLLLGNVAESHSGAGDQTSAPF
jgi:hypothetical protein